MLKFTRFYIKVMLKNSALSLHKHGPKIYILFKKNDLFSRAGNISKMSHSDNLRKNVACSSCVAYDKCKRSRVDGAISRASVLLLTHVDTHTYIHAHLWQRERDINEARSATCEGTSRKWIRKWDE